MDCLYSVIPNDREAWLDKTCKRFEPEETYPRLLATLTLSLKRKDTQLYLHSWSVQQVTHLFTRALNFSDEQVQMIELAALFHDIGKILLPDALLQKATDLTRKEFEMIREHPVNGALLLGRLGMPDNVVEVIHHHHEHWNGCGYPGGLRGEAIPLGARLIAIADAFEAMTTHRTYQATRTPRQALEELCRCAGTQFDPFLVELFYAELQAVLPGEPLYHR